METTTQGSQAVTRPGLIGVISSRTGKHLVWDAPAMRFANDAEANEYLDPPYRSGWTL